MQRREAFWQAIVDFFEVRFQQPPRAVLEEGAQMPSARWFPGATLNFAEHLLRRRDDAPALIAVSEDGRREVLSHAELARHVAGLQKRLAALGIGPGDRVAALMPNTWQTVVGMLATASLGATWSSCSPDFGTQGVIDRFGQIEPRVLIACAGYRYAGKSLDLTAKLNEVLAGLPGLEQLLVVPYDRPQAQPQDYRCQAQVALWDGFYQAEGEPVFTPVPFEQPLYILYSSGTTGVPKCIVHATGGVLLQHLKEHGLHTDLGDGDRLFYYTTCGWMMWNWLASGLAVGASLVLYDGSPFHPGPERLLDLIDAEDIAVFGASANGGAREGRHAPAPQPPPGQPEDTALHRFAAGPRKLRLRLPRAEERPLPVVDLRRHRHRFLLRHRQPGAAGVARRTAMQGAGHGRGNLGRRRPPPRQRQGRAGLHPAFPVDPAGLLERPGWHQVPRRLLRQLSRRLGPWRLRRETAHGGLVIHGRSDAVLNPGGVRIGTAEIYRQVEKVEEVLESIAIGQDWQGDVRVLLFVRLRDGVRLDEPLRERIRQTIRANATPRHVPAKIIQVADIPRTLSGKIVELAVRNVIHGRPVKNTDALANPQALELYRDLAELRD